MTREQLVQVRNALKSHDEWHCNIGQVIFPDRPDVTVDLTDGYGDSTLYSETCEALAILDAELALPEEREWAGSGNYTADTVENPHCVTFANGRVVWVNKHGALEVEWACEWCKRGLPIVEGRKHYIETDSAWNVKGVVIEECADCSHTPAGPWEAAK